MFKNIGVAFKFLLVITVAIVLLQVTITTIATRSAHGAADRIIGLAVDEFQSQKDRSAKQLTESLVSHGQSTAGLLSDVAAGLILGYDFDSLANLATSTANDPYVAWVNFYGTDDNPLTDRHEAGADTQVIRRDIEFEGMAVGRLELGLELGAVEESVAAVERRIDRVTAETQNEGHDATGAMVLQMIVASFVGILALCGVTYVVLRKVVIKPFYKLGIQLGQHGGSLASASVQVSDASGLLAQGTHNQAAAVDQTSDSLKQITQLIRDTAEHTAEVTRQASDASSAAQAGSMSMQNVTDAINRIKDSADQTAIILKSIDEIAFQTNLLALNAAVEAARAGEAGKGFAVVAEEVRSLAMRSAEAARDTARLIGESQTNADNGVEMAREMDRNLDAIVGNVNQVSAVIEEINRASARQTEGIENICRSVTEIETVTQSNASAAEESAAASRDLEELAEELETHVDVMMGVLRGSQRNRIHVRDRIGAEKAAAASLPVMATPRKSPEPVEDAGSFDVLDLDDADFAAMDAEDVIEI